MKVYFWPYFNERSRSYHLSQSTANRTWLSGPDKQEIFILVNSKSERKVNSLPPLGFELVISGMLAHLSNHSAKSHITLSAHSTELSHNLTLYKSCQSAFIVHWNLKNNPTNPIQSNPIQ
jgi:hypothetical protein